MLAWTIYISFIGVAWLLLLRPDDVRGARTVAMLSAGGGLLVSLIGALHYQPADGLVNVVDVPWVSQLGIRFHLAVEEA